MVEWEQMEMESPCGRCLWGSEYGDCIVNKPSIEDCEYGCRMYNILKEETNEVS